MGCEFHIPLARGRGMCFALSTPEDVWMHAKSLVPILAEIYGVPQETAFMIDRSLSECGLRAKGRGKSFPEMTRREAIIFLLACMVAQKATRAGFEVAQWVAASGYINDEIQPGDYPSEDYAALGEDPPQAMIDADEVAGPIIRNHYMQQVIARLGNTEEINLVAFLLSLCEVLKSTAVTGDAFKVEISVSHGWAAVSVNEAFSGGYSEVRFQTEAGSASPLDYEHQINKSAVVYGNALLALTIRTADPVTGDA